MDKLTDRVLLTRFDKKRFLRELSFSRSARKTGDLRKESLDENIYNFAISLFIHFRKNMKNNLYHVFTC